MVSIAFQRLDNSGFNLWLNHTKDYKKLVSLAPLRLGGCGFDSYSSHTIDYKIGCHFLFLGTQWPLVVGLGPADCPLNPKLFIAAAHCSLGRCVKCRGKCDNQWDINFNFEIRECLYFTAPSHFKASPLSTIDSTAP